MNRNRKIALAVGLAGLVAVIALWFLLSGEGAPPFPAIPGPPDALAPAPAVTRSAETHRISVGREASPEPETRPVQIPDAESFAPVPVEAATAPASADPMAKARKPVDPEPLRHAALRDPKNPQRWVDLAVAYNDNKNYDRAVMALRRALHVGKTYPGREDVQRLLRDYERMRRNSLPAAPQSPSVR